MQFLSHLLVFASLFVLCLTDTPDIHNWTTPASNCGGNEKTLTLLDISKECIQRAVLLYPNCDDVTCNKKEKSLAFLDVAMNVISEVKKRYPTGPVLECPKCIERPTNCPKHVDKPMGYLKHVERPMDCTDILRSGNKESGVYTIWPRSRLFTNNSLAVYCDMDTDGGGWTVIQRRGNFSTPIDYFYKDWESYKNGFGNLTEEFWIGNENIYSITNQAFLNKPYKIRFDLKDASGKVGYAEYSTFWIEDEAAKYALHIEGYKGNVGDSMVYQNKMKFTTNDRDSDATCAVRCRGAWWYNSCTKSNLNGLYQPGIYNITANNWHSFAGYAGLAGVEMKLRS